jgi:hypothetical protein
VSTRGSYAHDEAHVTQIQKKSRMPARTVDGDFSVVRTDWGIVTVRRPEADTVEADVCQSHQKTCLQEASLTATGEPSETFPGRKRARIACNSCRRRKARCDGNDPCGSCKASSIECHFVTASASLSQTDVSSLPDTQSGSQRTPEDPAPSAEPVQQPVLPRAASLSTSIDQPFADPAPQSLWIDHRAFAGLDTAGLGELGSGLDTFNFEVGDPDFDFWSMPPMVRYMAATSSRRLS